MLHISAPFGNYLTFPGAVRTRGTFTLHGRGGPLWRVWRAVASLRYNRRQQSWTNKMGLPNPGIRRLGVTEDYGSDLVSIHGFSRGEWEALVLWPCCPNVELNLSCPNVGRRPDVGEVAPAIELALRTKARVVCKLPPVRWMDWAVPLYGMGVRHFHCCNTIPTPGGGLSGKPLMQYSLWAVEEMRQRLPGVVLIGGGGVRNEADVREYRAAGADHVAIGSMLLNPLNWRRVAGLVAACGV